MSSLNSRGAPLIPKSWQAKRKAGRSSRGKKETKVSRVMSVNQKRRNAEAEPPDDIVAQLSPQQRYLDAGKNVRQCFGYHGRTKTPYSIFEPVLAATSAIQLFQSLHIQSRHSSKLNLTAQWQSINTKDNHQEQTQWHQDPQKPEIHQPQAITIETSGIEANPPPQ